MELWELHARERIRDTLAHYTWSGDGARLDDLALAFAPDGVLEIRGEEPLHGRDAIVARLSGVATGPAPSGGAAAAAPSGVRRIVRHNLANIRFTELTRERAAVSSYFTVFTEIGLDHYGDSAPAGDLAKEYGFTPEQVAARIKNFLDLK